MLFPQPADEANYFSTQPFDSDLLDINDIKKFLNNKPKSRKQRFRTITQVDYIVAEVATRVLGFGHKGHQKANEEFNRLMEVAKSKGWKEDGEVEWWEEGDFDTNELFGNHTGSYELAINYRKQRVTRKMKVPA